MSANTYIEIVFHEGRQFQLHPQSNSLFSSHTWIGIYAFLSNNNFVLFNFKCLAMCRHIILYTDDDDKMKANTDTVSDDDDDDDDDDDGLLSLFAVTQ